MAPLGGELKWQKKFKNVKERMAYIRSCKGKKKKKVK